MPSSRITRRRFGLVSAAAVSGIAGCSVLDSDNGERKPPHLGFRHLSNSDDAAHTLHVAVEQDDELVYWRSHDLGVDEADGDPPSFRTVDPTRNPETPGEFVVHGRLDGATTWNTDDLTTYPKSADPDRPDCWGVEMAVGSEAVGIVAAPTPDEAADGQVANRRPDAEG